MKQGWHLATLNVPLFQLPKGTHVGVRKTRLLHTSLGTTYWVLSIKHNVLYQVTESYAGTDCRMLLRIIKPVEDVERCEQHVRRLKEMGQYSKKRRRQIRSLLERRS